MEADSYGFGGADAAWVSSSFYIGLAMIRIFILHPHRLVWEGLSAFLENQPGLSVAGWGKNLAEVYKNNTRMPPDVILTTDELSGILNLQELASIHQRYPAAGKVVVLSKFSDKYRKRMLRLGGRAFLSTQSPLSEIVTAITRVYGGKQYISDLLQGHEMHNNICAAIETLTERELEVASMVVKGHSSKQVAAFLGITESTVDVHRKRILDKTGCNNTSMLVHLITNRHLSINY